MKLHPRLSRAAIALVSRFETFHAEAQAAGGGWTVGYGHTRSAREGARVSRADAEALLLYDLSAAAETVAAALYAPASLNQFEALTAFSFNIGPANFRASSALARFNAGQPLEAADEIERWRAAELGAGAQVVDALVRRRAAEKAHFLGLPEGLAKSPTALVRPLPAEGGLAAEAPVEASALSRAAEGVQARLRALVPEPPPPPSEPAPAGEPDAPPFPDLPEAPSAIPDPPARPEPEPLPPAVLRTHFVTEPANDTQAAGTAAAQMVAPAPPPPPPTPPPEGLAALESSAQIEEPPSAPAPSLPPVPAVAWRPSARLLYAAVAGLGAALFAAAVVLILGDRASPANLLLGLVGALLLAPGVYGLLGPQQVDALQHAGHTRG